jgi:hypothetical protein
MLYTVDHIYPLLGLALPIWVVLFFIKKDIPLLIFSILLLILMRDILFEFSAFVSTAMTYGFRYATAFGIVIASMVAIVIGITRSLKGLMVTILRSDAVLDSWNYIVEQGAGRGDFVLGTTERLVIDAHMPGVITSQEPVAMELFGEKRPFLIVTNTKHKEYKMYISARDFGANLDVSWYFTATPTFLKRTLSKYATGNPQDMTMRVSIFAQQDVSAFKAITHKCVTRTLDGLLEELNLDPASLNTGSRGFLNVW